MAEHQVTVIGAGLAGSEAAWQLARRGVRVRLLEMRPVRMTEAHQTAGFAELVCSNSLRNDSMETAVGVLKEEMRRLGSLVIAAADRARVPAGSALAVDRDEFSAHDHRDSRTASAGRDRARGGDEIPVGTDYHRDRPADESRAWRGAEPAHRSAQPVFLRRDRADRHAESVDMEHRFQASRYGKGGDDYINCPMTEARVRGFVVR